MRKGIFTLIFIGFIIFAFSPYVYSQENIQEKTLEITKILNQDTMRQMIEDALSSKEKNIARDFLVKFIVSKELGLNDTRDWMNLQYYNLAKEDEGIPEAIKGLEEIAVKDTGNIGLKASIAEGYLRLKDWKNVIRIYENLNKNYPDNSGIFTRLIDFYMNSQNYSTAIKKLEPLVIKDPENSPFIDILSFAYAASGRRKDALDLYKKMVEKKPDFLPLRIMYAQTLMDLGKPKESLKQWKEVLRLDRTNLTAREQLADIYEAIGKKKEAKEQREEIDRLSGNIESQQSYETTETLKDGSTER